MSMSSSGSPTGPVPGAWSASPSTSASSSASDLILAGFEPPVLSPGFAESLFEDVWGLSGTTEHLVGERTANIRLRTQTGPDYVLQVQRATGGPADDVFDMQTRAQAHAGRRSAGRLPHKAAIASVVEAGSQPWARVDDGETPLLARVVTFLDGVTFVDAGELPLGGYADIGELVGGVAAALADFRHPSARHPMPWDIANGLIVDDAMWSLLDHEARADLAPLRPRLERIASAMSALPQQTIHNDAHIGNLVRPDATSTTATGMIDFGDVVETVRAADVAIAAESFAPLHHDPVAVTAALVAGYQRTTPLIDAEIDAIGELVLARFALTVLLFAHQIRSVPRLGGRAAEAMSSVRKRLVDWAALDPLAITDAIHRTVDNQNDQPPGART